MAAQIPGAPRARIIFASGKHKLPSEFADAFTAAGFTVGDEKTSALADVAVIDARGASLTPKKAALIVSLLRRRSPDCAPVFIIDEAVGAALRAGLARHGEVICLTFDPAPLIVRIREIIRLRNIAEETGERLKSLASLNRLSEFPAILSEPAAPRLLIAGRAGAEALAAAAAARTIDASVTSVFSAGQAMRALDHQTFDCAIFIIRNENDPMLSLARAMRRHPRHSALPIITLAETVDEFGDYAERGARDFAAAPHLSDDFAAKLKVTARRGRLLKSMRAFLQTCAGDTVRDPVSSAFTPLFLSEHAPRVFARADQTGRALSVCAVKLTATARETSGEDMGTRALHQASRLINRVTRAEDVVARIAPDMFAVLMPSTTQADALRVSHRIEGVIENSVFRGKDERTLFSVKADTCVTPRRKDQYVEEIVAGMMRQLASPAVTPPRQQSPQ